MFLRWPLRLTCELAAFGRASRSFLGLCVDYYSIFLSVRLFFHFLLSAFLAALREDADIIGAPIIEILGYCITAPMAAAIFKISLIFSEDALAMMAFHYISYSTAAEHDFK